MSSRYVLHAPRPCVVTISILGSYCPIGSAVPTICPRGYYCPEGQSQATPCPPGSLGNATNLTSLASCQPCPGGQFCDQEGQWQPTGPCNAGYVCYGGASTSSPTDGVTGSVCPAGGYCQLGTVTYYLFVDIPCPLTCLLFPRHGIPTGLSARDIQQCERERGRERLRALHTRLLLCRRLPPRTHGPVCCRMVLHGYESYLLRFVCLYK